MNLRPQMQVALMLLTRLPAGRISGQAPAMGQTLWAWPLVGAGLGGLAALGVWLLVWLGVAPLVAGAAALALLAILTGGLHEDGLADVADGFGGGASRARKLEIMRDSRLGSYGALALVLAVGLRLAVMSELSVQGLIAGLIVLGAVSRAAMVYPLVMLPAAREDGLGAAVQVSGSSATWAVGIAVAAALLGFGIAGGATVLGAAALAAIGMGILARRQIGGQTGDVCGATQMVAEIAGWIALSTVLG